MKRFDINYEPLNLLNVSFQSTSAGFVSYIENLQVRSYVTRFSVRSHTRVYRDPHVFLKGLYTPKSVKIP